MTGTAGATLAPPAAPPGDAEVLADVDAPAGAAPSRVSGPSAHPADQARSGVRRWLRRLAVLVLVVWVLPNAAILGAHLTARAAFGGAQAYPGVDKFVALDAKVWRGAAPDMEGYRQLAADGVTTVVDLRAEAPPGLAAELEGMGLTLEHIPIRDGQAPGGGDVERFLDIVAHAPGVVFVHCGAGVGRTGVMAAAYLSSSGGGSSRGVAQNLALGTPTIEQLYVVAKADDGRISSAPALVTAASRVVDAPRRLAHVLGF